MTFAEELTFAQTLSELARALGRSKETIAELQVLDKAAEGHVGDIHCCTAGLNNTLMTITRIRIAVVEALDNRMHDTLYALISADDLDLQDQMYGRAEYTLGQYRRVGAAIRYLEKKAKEAFR